jgi:glycosyltransferase involved in cell wall biosynthesis
MSDKPLVSVIVIFLNAADFLQEAIESVLAQTYEHWELLLVDDGSTDGSSEIALSFAFENSARIKYFEHDGHQNLGMSAARNLGIRKAKVTISPSWARMTIGCLANLTFRQNLGLAARGRYVVWKYKILV